MYLKRANIAGNIIKLNSFLNGLSIKNMTTINLINKIGPKITSINKLRFSSITCKSFLNKNNAMISFDNRKDSCLYSKLSSADFKQVNKTCRRFYTQEIKKESANEQEKQGDVKKSFSKKRKSKVDKTIKLKNFPEHGKAILNIFSRSPILLTQSVTEANNNTKNLDDFNHEKKLYGEITSLLTEGKLREAALEISNLIDFLKDLEFSENKSISLLDNPRINNKTILKKIQIYKITLCDIQSILGSIEESDFHLKNAIYLMEANAEKLTDQDRFLLIKLKERLCTSYLSRDEFDFTEEKLNEECEKLLNSNIAYIEKKGALPEIQMQQNAFLNFQKMLLENLHYLGVVFKKQSKFNESNQCLLRYLQIKDRFPVLSQYLINVEYSVLLNLGINFLSLDEYENSISYFNLALGYLNDETKDNFLEARILIVDKLCDIYEKQGEMSKLMEQLEEKKRLTLALINLKTNSVKEFIENNSKLANQSATTPNEESKDKVGTNQNLNQNEVAEKEGIESNEGKEILKNDSRLESNKDQAASAEFKTDFKNDPIFISYEDFALKRDYLSLAKIYEELVELILESELQLEKFEEYLSEAQKYYEMLQKEKVFAANLNFILFIKNYDDSNYESALEYGLKVLKAINDFEARTTHILDPESLEYLKDHEIEFMQITEPFYYLDEKAQRAYLLKRFTSLDFYTFETKFKFYFYISVIYKALNNQEEKTKYQDLALKEYEELIQENSETDDDDFDDVDPHIKPNEGAKKDNAEISVLYLIDLMSIYENRKNSHKVKEVFDKIVSKIKAGEIDFLKKGDKEAYMKTVYDAYFMKINFLIFEEQFQEAKNLVKALDSFGLEHEDLKFSEEQKDNLDKTLNLLDLKLKYIK